MRLPQSSQHPNEAQPEPDADLNKVCQKVLRDNGRFALAVKTKHRSLQALTDWRSFRAQLVALEQTNSALTAELSTASEASSVWVHELSLPEKGCLLLGRMECMGQFTNAVILLCQHGMWCCVVAEQAVQYTPLDNSDALDSKADMPSNVNFFPQTPWAAVVLSSTCHSRRNYLICQPKLR